MNTIFITVRTASSRLPNKCLKTIGNMKIIDYAFDKVNEIYSFKAFNENLNNILMNQ